MQPIHGQNGHAELHEPRRRTLIIVPDSARELKPLFVERPNWAKVLEIVRHVVATGESHTHPEVTYARIAPGTEVVFLEKFSIHERFAHDEDRWCLCAACGHDYPQFKNDGVLLWVKADATVRIVGWDCFRRHDPEAHARASKQYEADTKARKNETYLLDRLCLVPQLQEYLVRDIATASAFSTVHVLLNRAFIELESGDVAKLVRRGRLRVEVQVAQHNYKTGARKVTTHKKDYAPIKGASFLSQEGRPPHLRMMRVQELLRAVRVENCCEEVIAWMPDHEKSSRATMLGDALKEWLEARRDLDAMRQFIRPPTGKTLQKWSSHPGAPISFHFEYSEEAIAIGKSVGDARTIPIPVPARSSLSTLPHIVTLRRR